MSARRGKGVSLTEEQVASMLRKRLPIECLRFATMKANCHVLDLTYNELYQLATLGEANLDLGRQWTERHQAVQGAEVVPQAYPVRRMPNKKFACYRCGEERHTAKRCATRGQVSCGRD
eukprot:Protomagalhaensia_sp_Gyna_25__2986@NODE_2760_length_901_cov_5_857309_g2304_i0_p1_GENE_NODE_2760_length_901_cov_5_857309_g2304_i0NODE_2760_length_901_cov_5_857309_g2304_i0_p1_ORF_typecomplete_len119_score1_02zfCCHC/PF00098_23/0_013zfCCHC_4/PF14392_6/0_13Transglut_prok/PF09017_10/0_2_NODE_2760_length_901_cov_5_857309_g2304_i0340696